MFLFIIVIIVACCEAYKGRRTPRLSLRMDDEVARFGIKTELTTREEYLSNTFVRLSESGHDVTPWSDVDFGQWEVEYKHSYDNNKYNSNKNDKYLGENRFIIIPLNNTFAR